MITQNTLKSYVNYRGKKYSLIVSDKYFKRTAGPDNLVVHNDPLPDRAVQADSKTTRPAVLLLLIVLSGFILVGSAISDLYRQLTK